MKNILNRDKDTVSLVIPTYNRGDLIGATLDSALNQSSPFSEIITVDDGSTDHTSEVLRNYADRIRIIRTPNKGVQEARNKGAAAAQSKYITLCDSDDILEPGFVASIVPWLSAHPPCDIVYCNFVTFDEYATYADKFSLAPAGFFNGGKREDGFLSEIPDLYARTMAFQPLFATGVTFRKSFFEELGGYNAAFNGVGSEDWEFTLRAAYHGNVALCTHPLTRIRRHAGNASADPIRMSTGEAKILEYFLKSHKIPSKQAEVIYHNINARRIGAFNVAFAKGDFNSAKNILSLLDRKPKDLKFKIKNMIILLPDILRQAAWWITQN